MGRGRDERVLRQKTTTNNQISRRCALAPARAPIHARTIIDIPKNERSRLMLRRLSKHSDSERRDASRVQHDRDVVQVLEHTDAERVNEPVGREHGSVDADRLRRRGFVVGAFDGGDGGDEVREAERDARRHGDLAEEVEPARDPGGEGGPARRRHHGGPEVRAAACRDGGYDFAHGCGHGHCEEGYDDPADAHH